MVPLLPFPALQWMTTTFLASSLNQSCILRVAKGISDRGGGW